MKKNKKARKINFPSVFFHYEGIKTSLFLSSVILLSLLFFLLQPVFAGEKTLPLPKQIELADSREKFSTPVYKSGKHGDFRFSIGECMGGDPGFGSFNKGDEFDLELYIYHMEPKDPMGHVSERVILGKGVYGKSITPAITKPVRVKYKGLTFTVKLLKTSHEYGAGKNVVRVDVGE